jgi:seryl-tRNA synthetase
VVEVCAEHRQGEQHRQQWLISANYEQESARREVNLLQKEIGAIKKAKGDASELLGKKNVLDKKIADLTTSTAELVKKRDKLAARIGNIVDPKCHISLTEVSTTAKGLKSGRQPNTRRLAPRAKS